MPKLELGHDLRDERHTHGWTINELEARSGVSRAVIFRYEADGMVSQYAYGRVRAAFGCNNHKALLVTPAEYEAWMQRRIAAGLVTVVRSGFAT